MIKDKSIIIEDEDNIFYIFKGSKYFPLDNFYEDDIEVSYEGLLYTSAEAAFQSAKRVNVRDRIPFTKMSAAESKAKGKDPKYTKLRYNWNEIKDKVMLDIVADKMERNPWIAKMLLDTRHKHIEEGNTWGDLYWGVDLKSRKGQNQLGKTLMSIRRELQQLKDLVK